MGSSHLHVDLLLICVVALFESTISFVHEPFCTEVFGEAGDVDIGEVCWSWSVADTEFLSESEDLGD